MKKLTTLAGLLLLLLCSFSMQAQIGMGGTPHPSAVLDLKSPANDKAFYPPRLTSTQRKAIAQPQAGAFVYDTDKSAMYLYDGQRWLPLLTGDPNRVPLSVRTASDGAEGDNFGRSVAISGDFAVVGAPDKEIGSNASQGAAYIFRRTANGWTEQTRLTANNGASFDYFGASVAISGNYVVVGAYGKTIGGAFNRGAAYMFFQSAGGVWSQVQQLVSTDPAAFDAFGNSVAISPTYVVVGASGKTIGTNSRQGAVYVFSITAFSLAGPVWGQDQRLIATDGAATDGFGTSIAISGTSILVGAPRKTILGNANEGAAYVFLRSTFNVWIQQVRLTSADVANAYFGQSVAIAGDRAVVGSYGRTVSGNASQGRAYAFLRTSGSWNVSHTLSAPTGAAGDWFGYSVAVQGDYVLIGAPNRNGGGIPNQGAVYVFQFSKPEHVRQLLTDINPSDRSTGGAVALDNGRYIINGTDFEESKGKVSFGTLDN